MNTNSNEKNLTKVTTGKIVLQYPHFFKANTRTQFENSQPKYDTTVIINKADEETLSKINTAFKNAVNKGNFPDNVEIKLPLKDGDIFYPGETLYENSMFLYTSSVFKPKVVDHNLNKIEYKIDEYQSGTYAKLSLEFVPYHFNGKCGVAARLLNVQVFPQNRLLELRSNPEDDFVVEVVDEE